MDPKTLEWFELLARGLLFAAAVVLVLAVIAAIAIVSSDSSVPFFADVQRESRGIAAIGSLAAGITAAGVLSALGAILRLQLAAHTDRDREAPPRSAER